MKVGARNVFEGIVSGITAGAVNAEIELTLAGGDKLIAIITEASVKGLGLAVGSKALAFVKAPWVIVLGEDVPIRFSARNQLAGTVSALTKGAVNSDVKIKLAGGTEVHAVITNDAVSELALAVGKPASALIKASHVVLGVSA
ncbi:TOBE domain-containing protein [Niveibacterium sp. SC-1]|uniref:TOBE domain-containing protein n=1 Tax=Niveibacterium sp. SC-1 TaxID=3135646 RepID=UPI00311E9795